VARPLPSPNGSAAGSSTNATKEISSTRTGEAARFQDGHGNPRGADIGES
jgi:hypothetical protein